MFNPPPSIPSSAQAHSLNSASCYTNFHQTSDLLTVPLSSFRLHQHPLFTSFLLYLLMLSLFPLFILLPLPPLPSLPTYSPSPQLTSPSLPHHPFRPSPSLLYPSLSPTSPLPHPSSFSSTYMTATNPQLTPTHRDPPKQG